MKKFAGVVAAAALAVCMLAAVGCSSNSGTTDNGSTTNGGTSDNASTTDTTTTETTKFIVGFDAEYPPYGFIDTTGEFGTAGSYVGFDLDLAKAVCEKNGWEFSATPVDWDLKDSMLDSGQITCIWNGFTYEGREDGYVWSKPYMLNAQVVVTKAGAGISTLDDLAGKTVMTQVDSAGYDVVTSDDYAAVNATFAGGAIKTIGDYNNAFMQLESGAVDAVVCDLSIFMYQDAAKPGVFSNVITLSSEHYAVGLSKNNPDAQAMADTINTTLKALDEDGTVKQLCEKYASYGIDYANWILE